MSSSNGNNEEEEDYCFHPESKWEEPYSDLVLTLYDLHRIPRPVKDAKLRLTVPLKHLNSEFVCPICLGYMRKTSMVMECLHRFCNECIQKCLRIGKKECPSCRIHIPSRRSLRLDPEFDSLILHILGDVKVLEENEEKEAQLAVNRNKSYLLSRKRRSEEELESRVCALHDLMLRRSSDLY
jgi:E3 ubiquitin-protein ligase RNF1/2